MVEIAVEHSYKIELNLCEKSSHKLVHQLCKMKNVVVSILLVTFFLFTALNCQTPVSNPEPARAVQIITLRNHTFHLETNDLKEILEANNIKDRHVVVLPIAGSYRKGKSFLLNFFVRYLEAKVTKI